MAIVVLLVGWVSTTSCDRAPALAQSASTQPGKAAPDARKPAGPAGKAAGYIDIQPYPPHDTDAYGLTELGKFAWQQLLALSWKAAYDPSSGAVPAGVERGQPDLKWNYYSPTPQLLAWQTYAQTTELRPNHPLTTPWAQLGLPRYSYKNPVTPEAGARADLWNNLDEDNEIGSCDIYGHYGRQLDPKKLVLYQVKVNKDEYEYLRTNFPDQDDPNGKLYKAQTYTKASIAAPDHLYYDGFKGSCAPCDPNLAICLPCGSAAQEGAIEVKSAWRMLLPTESGQRFFTTNAIYYDLDSKGGVVLKNGRFALVGIHVIHKTTRFPYFIFTTFEQIDVEQSDSRYVELTKDTGEQTGPAVPIVRQGENSYNRTQLLPIPKELLEVNRQVQAQLKAISPTTAWQYYRLAGVQATPIDCKSSASPPPGGKPGATQDECVGGQVAQVCLRQNPTYYMANFMIESDPFLNNFSGPGFGTNPLGKCDNLVSYHSTGFGKPVAFPQNIGGCQGCHGVAQTSFGTDFSFLLDFGNNKPSIEPATLYYYPPALRRVQLKHFLQGLAPISTLASSHK